MEIDGKASDQFPAPAAVSNSAMKRAIDIVVALLLLVLFLPLLLVLCMIIMLESRGSPIFGQKRRGKNGETFTILKLRTMRARGVHDGVRQATRDDDRITWTGRILRRTSIDELPQLLNVLAGHMSLVGPRPHAIEHDNAHSLTTANYTLRFRTRPGLTGLAQISGLRGEIKTPDCIVKRVDADNQYIDRWSHWLDLKIVLMTIPHLVLTRQAY